MIPMQFGDRLKQIRINKDLKQEDAAKMLGIDRSTYTNYENNARFPTKETLIRIIAVLNISVDYLLSGQELLNYIEDKEIELYKIPVIKTLSLKKDSISWDNVLYYKNSMLPHDEGNNYFYYKIPFKVKDNERVKKNDLILFHTQNEAEDGNFIVAIIDNDNICVGKIEFIEDAVLILPITMDVPNQMFKSDSLHRLKIIAKAVEGLYELS